MKLVDFSVTNFRSITKAHKISLNNLTVLVGRNNEGKSNLLNGLNVAMQTMILHTKQARGYSRLYNWERDFPVQFQERRSGLESIFRLNFRLDHEENIEFTRVTGIRSNEDIPIEIKYGRDNMPKIRVPKKGSSSFTNKSKQVTAFICEGISFNYIQAVRTENMAMDVIHQLLFEELAKLEDNTDYQTAMQTIKQLQKGVYDDISNRVLAPLQEFLPQLTSVEIIERKSRYPMRRLYGDLDIILDDGTPTSISYKGDGIKSLVSLAILKNMSPTGRASIIAIEEPESHLHPDAIHSLVGVINGVSENHQVVITTHNPLFVQRNSVAENVIVNDGTAKPAKSIKEIRDILGVLPEDNLINASHVLVVEGEDDKIALTKILKSLSPTLKKSLNKNTFVIQPLSGASNLNYELSRLRSFVCKYFVFLDNDDAGISAGDKAIEKGLLTEADIKYTICNGNPHAEFEDCLNKDFYIKKIKDKFSVDLSIATFKGSKKWSDNVKDAFLSQGQRWTETIEKKVKTIVADTIPDENADGVLNQHKRGSIDALVTALENMLTYR